MIIRLGKGRYLNINQQIDFNIELNGCLRTPNVSSGRIFYEVSSFENCSMLYDGGIQEEYIDKVLKIFEQAIIDNVKLFDLEFFFLGDMDAEIVNTIMDGKFRYKTHMEQQQ